MAKEEEGKLTRQNTIRSLGSGLVNVLTSIFKIFCRKKLEMAELGGFFEKSKKKKGLADFGSDLGTSWGTVFEVFRTTDKSNMKFEKMTKSVYK